MSDGNSPPEKCVEILSQPLSFPETNNTLGLVCNLLVKWDQWMGT